jgi:multidrug resistance protein, MATE family
MAGLAQVRATALSYVPYVIALPLVALFASLFDGVFIGATRTAEMRNGMALALAAFLGSVALLMPPFGNHGLWLAMLPVNGCPRHLARRLPSVHRPARRVRRPTRARQAPIGGALWHRKLGSLRPTVEAPSAR